MENLHTRGEARGHAPADSGAGADSVSVRILSFSAPAAGQNAGSSGSKTRLPDEISTIQMVHGYPSVEKILDGRFGHLAHGVFRQIIQQQE